MSGQVDWIEAPAPDALATLKQRGFKSTQPAAAHLAVAVLLPAGLALADKRVRQAANLCVNRTAMKQLLGGMMVEATGIVEPGHPWRGKPKFQIKYDVPAAQALMQQAGYGPSKHLKVKVQTSASGSGQMQPLPMNEVISRTSRAATSTWTSTWSSGTRCSPAGAWAPRTRRARRQRHQRDRRHDGPVLRDGALRQHQGLPAGVQQLGLLQQPEGGCHRRQGAHHLRRQEA
jgi:hypothetical protein